MFMTLPMGVYSSGFCLIYLFIAFLREQDPTRHTLIQNGVVGLSLSFIPLQISKSHSCLLQWSGADICLRLI